MTILKMHYCRTTSYFRPFRTPWVTWLSFRLPAILHWQPLRHIKSIMWLKGSIRKWTHDSGEEDLIFILLRCNPISYSYQTASHIVDTPLPSWIIRLYTLACFIFLVVSCESEAMCHIHYIAYQLVCFYSFFTTVNERKTFFYWQF